MIEKIARAHYAEYMRDVADLEPRWDQLPEDHKDRMLSAMETALSTIEPELEAMREAMYGGQSHES